MRVSYDVPVPRNTFGKTKYAGLFWDFYDSHHETVKFEFDTTEEAFKAQKAMCNLRNYEKIFDVEITRRHNVLYLIRSELPC